MAPEEWFDEEIETEEEWLRRLRRKKRIEELRRRRRRAQMLYRCVMCVAAVLVFSAGFGAVTLIRSATADGRETKEETDPYRIVDAAEPETEEGDGLPGDSSGAGEGSGLPGVSSDAADGGRLPGNSPEETQTPEEGEDTPSPVFSARITDSTAGFGEQIVSEYGILMDVESGIILAHRSGLAKMNPASMTKVLTVLTAAELLGVEDENAGVLEDVFEITIQITDYCYVNDCSVVGFDVGETVTIRDLFYGTVLPSGADAALGLAFYTAGSQEAFVEKMNEKLEELGLAATTHFTNCVGLYGEDHYSTAYDIAVILKEATDNAFCRRVLSEHTHTIPATEQHPEGIPMSNWFLRRIEDRDTHGEVLCGKTGYVNQAGSCAVSLATDTSGREYLCVTAGADSSWQCIRDQVELYQSYLDGD